MPGIRRLPAMTAPVLLACLWLIAANVVGMLPSRRGHWPAAWVLIATGLPILGWMILAGAGWWAALFVAAAASILRWPLRRGIGRLRQIALGPRGASGGSG